MKKVLILTALILLFLFAFAKEWTIMLYICGDNNLVSAINGDIDEIEAALTDTSQINFLVQVDGKSLREVAQFVSAKLATINGVQSTVTHFLLKKYKEDGVILVETADSKRLPVTP